MDFYIVLWVNRGASLPEVKKAYRRLARRLHPDVNPGDERAAVRFREIAEAYATLSDPDRRQRYDVVGYEAAVANATHPYSSMWWSWPFLLRPVWYHFKDVPGDSSHVVGVWGGGNPLLWWGGFAAIVVALARGTATAGVPSQIVRQTDVPRVRGHGVASVAAVGCPSCDGVGSLRTARDA
jgi:DnaJ-class molecular chaperone